jgi:predicted trehalose synthase
MPRPRNERQALGQELREELPAQLAACRRELAAGLATQREWLEWHIRRVQKRMADVEARLAKVSVESGPQP